MRCQEIMCRHVEVIAPDDGVPLAALRMREQRIGFLPVCERDGRVVGVVTDRDIALRVCADHLLPDETQVRDVMSKEVVSCRDSDSVAHALDLMARRQKMRIIVFDALDRLAGVISWSDLAQVEEPLRVARLMRDVAAREYRVRSVRP